MLSALLAHAQDLIVFSETPAFTLDTRLPSTDPGPGSLIVQAETPTFTLDTRLPDGVAPSSGTLVTESGPFTLDTRLRDGVTPSSGTVVAESSPFTLDTRLPGGISFTNGVVIAESPPFTLDTRLPTDTTPPASFVVTAESPPFTLNTRLPGDTTPLPNLITQAETPPFTLDTRLPSDTTPQPNLITQAESAPFTLNTLSGAFTTPAQTLTGGSTGGRVRFSPDGLQLAKADGTRVLLWNLHSIRTNVTFTGHAGEVTTVEFSPLGDQLLTGSADGTMRWWDTASRTELGRTTPPGSGTVYAAYASDGARILAGRGANGSLYRVPSLQLAQEFTGSAGTISSVAVCPEGLAFAGNSDRFGVIWNIATGQILCHLTNHTKLITAAAFLPGGTNALTASLDGTIRLWDAATGAERFRIQASAQVGDAALSLDGRVSASCDTANPGTAYLWDAHGGLLRVFTDTGSEASQIKGVAISPDHTLLATTHVDGRVRLWDTGLTPCPAQTVTVLGMSTNAQVTLRSHGLYYFELAAEPGRSLVVTLEAASAPVASKLKLVGSPAISVGQALSSDAEFANLGAGTDKNVAGPNGAQLLSFRPAPTYADITAFRMTAMTGKLPSEYDYETFAQASITNLHCEMPLVTAASDKVYVLVFAPYLSAGNINARIRVEYSDFHLSSVVPSRGGNSGNVTARIQGTGIAPDTTARLVGPGGATVTSQLAMWGDSTKAWFTFSLSNAPVGAYQVEISKPGATPVALASAFQVVSAVGPQLQSSLTAPSAVRPGRDYGMTLTYANVGDVDMAAPLFIVSAEGQRPWIYSIASGSVPMASQGSGGTPSAPRVAQVQILGLNQDGPPGVLPPRASYEIPLYFQGDGGALNMAFNLSVLKADTTAIDWTTIESRFQPADVESNLWAAVWANFKSTIGTTWADYLRALDNQAHLLALAGQPSYDAGGLTAGLFGEAGGVPYRRTLAAAVDAQSPAPGLPLRFSRFATDALGHRFTVGPLGRGWSHNYEYALTPPTNGVVVIRTPAGARRFTLGSDNVWHGETGHYAALTANAGGFVLIEKEGTSWQFNASGLLVSVEEPNRNRVTLSYSGSQLTSLTHSAGPSFTLQYNGQGRLSRLTDAAGQATDYEYDPSGDFLLRVISPGGVINSYTYQPAIGSAADHALTSVTFPDNTHQYFEWNGQGRLARQYRDGGAELQQFDYAPGGLMTVRDAKNAATTLRFGTRGQVVEVTDPLGHIAAFKYDNGYNPVRIAGPAGEISELRYDASGNATNLVNSLGQDIALGYADLNRLGLLRDARDQTTGFTYDSLGNLTNITYVDTSAEHFGYDPAGNLTTSRNRRGHTIQYARNSQGQITQKLYPDGRTIGFGYDARGYLTNVTDSAQGTTSMGYDLRGLLSNITYPDGKGFAFEYNAAGRRTRRVGHDGYTLNYGYDAAGRLASLTEGVTNGLVRYAYEATGRLSREDKGNGTFTTYAYDLAGQIVALTNHAPNGTAQSFFNYTYDAKGNRLTMTTAAGRTRYDYDALNQLTGVTYPGGRRVTYAYDPAGNRTLVTDNGTNTVYSANALNQYTQAGAATFGYDTDGNMTQRTDATGITTYEYDFENRLVRVVTPTNGVFQYTYDALGNRTAVIHDDVAIRYLHDPVGLVDVATEYDNGGGLVARYDHALGLVARKVGAGSTAFYAFDALGSTRELTADTGAVLSSYDYDAFGAATVASEGVPNNYRFAGRFGVAGLAEENGGMLLMRQRHYFPDIGRFSSIDPIRLLADVNAYRYAINSPVVWVDPSGLDCIRGGGGPCGPGTPFSGGRLRGPGTGLIPAATGVLTVTLGAGIVIVGTGVAAVWSAPAWVPQLSLLRYTWPFVPAIRTAIDIGLASIDGLPDSVTDPLVGNPLIGAGFTVYKAVEPFIPPTVKIGGPVGISVVRPYDPNDKIGPNGVGPNRVVSTNDFMEYMVRFENMASASAPVQELIVVDYLDAGLDWTTIRFKELSYGGRIITPTAGSQSFAIRDTPPADSPAITGITAARMVVNTSGSVNSQMGRVEWRLSAMDTNTSFFPLDALTGFLPPEDGTGRGQGYVKLAVRPKNNLPIGTVITNRATIIFDGNDPMNTPAVWNIVGDVPSLAATIAYLPGQIMAGMPFTYTIGLTNGGSTSVTSVVLTNALPTGMAVVGASATWGTVTITNGTIIWDLGTLANGYGGMLTVTALPGSDGTFANGIFFRGGSGLAVFNPPSDITVVPTIPRLDIRIFNGQVILFWSTNATGFRLQRASALPPSGAWNDATNTPAIQGPEFRVQLGKAGGTEFYRLVNP